MKISLLLSFLFAAITVSAQVNPQCPTVSVDGPLEILKPGELIPFSATVTPTESKLTYKWTVSRGRIVEGQGTQTIKVSIGPDDPDLTAKVEIGGLPAECGNLASETISDLAGNMPMASKLDTFSLPLSSINESRFQKIAESIYNNPTSQLYVLVPTDRSIWTPFTERLDKFTHKGIVPPRITYVETNGEIKIIEVWLVPPGATPPSKCEACERPEGPKPDCPAISITGPAGITVPGDIMSFKAVADRDLIPDSKFEWTVTAGTIESGQSSPSIRVSVPLDMSGGNITARVRFSASDANCVVSASETAGIATINGPEPIDSYGLPSLNEEKARMQNAAFQARRNPDCKLLIIRYLPRVTAADRRRIRQLSAFLIKNGLRPEQFQFIIESHPDPHTAIWLPPREFVYKPSN